MAQLPGEGATEEPDKVNLALLDATWDEVAGPSGFVDPVQGPLSPAALAAVLGVKLVPPPEPPKGLDDDQRRRWSEAYEAALQRGLTVREARRLANAAVRLGA